MSETEPKMLQLVTQDAVTGTAMADIESCSESEWCVENRCDRCQSFSLGELFDQTKAPDGGFPDESRAQLKALVDVKRAEGWRHHKNFYGMIQQCEECARRDALIGKI